MNTNFMTRTTKELLPITKDKSSGNSQGSDELANLYNESLIAVSAQTDIGLIRSRNEDSFAVADLTTGKAELEVEYTSHRIGERGALLVVADGMGGAAAGKLASEMAVTALCEDLIHDSANHSFSARLANATEVANRQVYEFASQHPEYTGMGTTLTAILVHDNSAYVSQVGDSRAYLIRDDKIHQLTKDQTLVQKLLDDGNITPEEAVNYSRHVILQAVGPNPTVNYALAAIELYHDDYLVLCSDGLSGNVASEEILEAVQNSTTLPDACKLLVDLAIERGGEDNITLVIARLYEVKVQSDDQIVPDLNLYKRVA